MQKAADKKELVEIKTGNSFLDKIKSFFKRIFGKETVVKVEATIGRDELKVETPNKKEEFTEALKSNSDVEADPNLLELQRKFRNGNLTVNDLTEEQEDQLIDLYDKQIAVKKAKIEELKAKLDKIKKAS